MENANQNCNSFWNDAHHAGPTSSADDREHHFLCRREGTSLPVQTRGNITSCAEERDHHHSNHTFCTHLQKDTHIYKHTFTKRHTHLQTHIYTYTHTHLHTHTHCCSLKTQIIFILSRGSQLFRETVGVLELGSKEAESLR